MTQPSAEPSKAGGKGSGIPEEFLDAQPYRMWYAKPLLYGPKLRLKFLEWGCHNVYWIPALPFGASAETHLSTLCL